MALISSLSIPGTLSAPHVEAEVASQIVAAEGRSVEEYVYAYFSDIPVMKDIAWCESKFRHTNKHGSVLRGEEVPSDVGVMQINEYYHGATAKRLGLNLHEFGDNLVFARYLFEDQGTTPWLSSVRCWGEENHIGR